ncbi:DUF3048 domain-containing protein [Nocardioides sp. LHG3406-4]|uniref:DUF3048 domain-containing protein n=1 Tax=Nocardioides sp. LHG3406-4 TaxID=2804575 RepID=UPI003CF51E55
MHRPLRTKTASRLGVVVATLFAMSMLLAGCGDKGGTADPGDTSSSGAPAGSNAEEPPPPETWPLTGTPVAGDGTADLKHPVMVTKMDNTAGSAPQLGLSKADLVVEELVEGGATRLAAFYYSQLPEVVGPVRSMRASDIGIVSPVDADIITSGAAGVTIGRIQQAGIRFFQEGAKGFFREGSRYAPYNLMARPREVVSVIKQKPARPDDYLRFGDAADLPKGQKASRLSAFFGGMHTTNWAYANGGYVNQNSYAAQGDEFPADTVLVLRVQVGDAGYRDPAGNFVPETKFEGSGDALLFHGGRVVKGTWKKDGVRGSLRLDTKKGGDLAVPAGRTWLELVPADGGRVTYGK